LVIVHAPRPPLKFSDKIGAGQEDDAVVATSVTLPPLQIDAEVGVTVGVGGADNNDTVVVTTVEQVPMALVATKV
jgi:hypothetical protein